jgi:hypothetical protein
LGRTCTGWIAPACLAHSFYELVCTPQDDARHVQSKRPRGFQIEDQLNPAGRIYRQITGPGTLEN